jgi:hypothetical protein
LRKIRSAMSIESTRNVPLVIAVLSATTFASDSVGLFAASGAVAGIVAHGEVAAASAGLLGVVFRLRMRPPRGWVVLEGTAESARA